MVTLDDGKRDLNSGPKKYGYNVSKCKSACSGFKYSALQAGGWCSCGNSYSTKPQYKKRPDGECGAIKDDGGRHGGGWRNAIYQI